MIPKIGPIELLLLCTCFGGPVLAALLIVWISLRSARRKQNQAQTEEPKELGFFWLTERRLLLPQRMTFLAWLPPA